MSQINVDAIRASNGTGDAISLTASDKTCTANITNNLSNRNLIINGAQVIDQRGVSTEVTPIHEQYLTDRWQIHVAQTSKLKAQQVTDSPVGFSNSLKVTSLSAYTPVATDYFLINQFIEGYNMSHLGWGAAGAKTVTISFWVKSSVTGNYAVALRQPWNRAQNQSYTISSADTWEKKSLTFTGDTSGTWNSTNGSGMSVGFILGGGSNYEATSGSWSGSSAFRFSGATNLVATNAATFYITGVQLEVGDYATDFEHRSYGDELDRCQRYFQTWRPQGVNAPVQATLMCYSSSAFIGPLHLRKIMRAAPTLTNNNIIGITSGNGSAGEGTLAIDNATPTCARLVGSSFSGLSAGNCTWIQCSDQDAYFDLSAEL